MNPLASYSDLLEEITVKQDWYSKVFNKELTQKWYEECPDKDVFWTVIRILQLTAQGCDHKEQCSWTNETCEACRKELLADGKNSYSDYSCNSYEEFLNNLNDFASEEMQNCKHVRCQCLGPDRLLHNYVVYKKDIVSESTHKQLKALVTELEAETVDMHPELNREVAIASNVVRDLVHPSLNCYVHTIDDEREKYQWLPAEVEIDGAVRFVSPINNLDQEKYSYKVLEECLADFLPSLYKVLGKEVDHLQVIVKIGSIELDTDNPKYPGGSWHIEGMPYERIIATCLHYINVDGITDSYLQFRKPVYLNEMGIDYPQCDENYTSHHYGIERGSHYDGQMNLNLGLIKAQEGYSVIFPNFLQHRVKSFRLAEGVTQAKRTILAFFVVDPSERILSTADGPFPLISKEEASENRIKLMLQRKYFVDELNKIVYEREYSLCEH